MLTRLTNYLRTQSLGIAAVLIALGGGGGYAIAATSHTSSNSIRACAVKKTGELLLKSRCNRAETAVSWNKQGPAGTSPVTGYGVVNPSGAVTSQSNLTISAVGTGDYQVSTSASCKGTPVFSVVPVLGSPNGAGQPLAWIRNIGPYQTEINTGYLTNGVFAAGSAGFEIHMVCGQ